MAARLEIKRSIAPNNLWHWMVVFDSGHIFATSEESYESAEICAASASLYGLDSLHAAERVEKRSAGGETSTAGIRVAPMANPTFDRDGDPTDETLAAIEEWQADFSEEGCNPWAGFIQFCREAWNMDYGTVREEVDEDGETLPRFVTGGWSANEAVQGAMMGNMIFRVMRWHSSYRGGLVKYATR